MKFMHWELIMVRQKATALAVFLFATAQTGTAVAVKFCAENVVPAVPEIVANADDYLREVDCTELSTKENADPAVPEPIEIDDSNFSGEDAVLDEEAKGNAFIAMVAEMMKRNLAAQGVIVPAFEPTKKQI